MRIRTVSCLLLAVFLAESVRSAETPPMTDGEVWNQGVDYYRAGDVTNALRVLKPLMLTREFGARAAEVVSKLAYEAGDLESSAFAAQIALRAHPTDERVNRNFTRATDRLPEIRETKHISEVLKASQGKDPSSLMSAATAEARALMKESATYRTNAAERVVALADSLSNRARQLADTWIPVREAICQSVTNEEQAATILTQVAQAQEKTKTAARELADLRETAYETLSDVEHDYTRFLKMTALPPVAISEDSVAQSNAWLDVEAFNGRSWQQDALDYTRAFRAKFPAWARAYEQQAQADTNKPPFSAEDQAKISVLATELEKVQLECVEKCLPPRQEEAVQLIRQIRELLPKDSGGGGNSPQNQSNDEKSQSNQEQQKSDTDENQAKGEPPKEPESSDSQTQQDDPEEEPKKEDEPTADEPESDETDSEVESILKKAQERNDEHEAEKKARMRKAPLPPNERDW